MSRPKKQLMPPMPTFASTVIEHFTSAQSVIGQTTAMATSYLLPHQHRFISPNEYFSTCFHELVHWSEVRLDWTGSYALGELIAEIGSCFLCSHVNLPCSSDLSNHTAYLQGWLKELENDPKAILKASSQASKAAGFVLSFSRQHEAEGAEAA